MTNTVGPIVILPFPYQAQPNDPSGGHGIVPPWLVRDMGVQNVTPTNAAQRGWRLIVR